MYKLLEADETLSEKYWQKLFDLKVKQKSILEFNAIDIEEFKKWCLGNYNFKNFKRYIVVDDNSEVLGEFFSRIFDPKISENLGEVIKVIINIVAEDLNDDILKIIFSKIISHYNNDMRILLNADNYYCNHWYRKYKGVIYIEIENYLLKKSKLNTNLLKDWANTISKNNPDFTLEFYKNKAIPKELVEKFVDLWDEFDNQTPCGDFPTETKTPYSDFSTSEKNEIDYCILLFDKSGELSGLSSCNFKFHEDDTIKNSPKEITKELTGVKDKYRGRSLAKWMLAVLYMKIANDFEFEEIHTQMVRRNKYMQIINKELGYQKTGYSEQEYIFDQDELKKILGI